MNPPATATAAEPTERPVRPPEFWDGVDHAFNPTGPVKVPPNLKLSTEAETEIDPITYEVVRHGLWNANAEHVREIENLAVSQITVEIRDFQPCILTEDAELLYFGPCLQYMSGMLDMMTRYILEHRGERVRDGDMWLCNDPIIGTAHQPDVGLMCPVFVGEELFCWVANISHQNDIGGTVPGSFRPNAARPVATTQGRTVMSQSEERIPSVEQLAMFRAWLVRFRFHAETAGLWTSAVPFSGDGNGDASTFRQDLREKLAAFFRGLPADVSKRLTGALQAALKEPKVTERLVAIGAIAVPPPQQTPEALAEHLKAEVAKWSPVIKASGDKGT